MLELQSRRKRTTELEGTAKRKRNNIQGMIIEGVNLPLRIIGCQEGKVTQYGTGTLRFDFQHLESKEEFTSIIFETKLHNSVSDQIIEAALPVEMGEYDPKDLVNCGMFAKVKIITKDGRTFINVVEAKPLNEKYSEMLEEMLTEEFERQMEVDEVSDNDDEMIEEESDIDVDDLDIDEEDDNYELDDED